MFPRGGSPPRWKAVPPGGLPEPYRTVLVHRRHMTVALEERHGGPVELCVLDRLQRGETYSRRLVLKVKETGAPALFGIMRIHLSAAPPAARAEILAESAPLGAILIAHQVLRRIEPLVYLEIEPDRFLKEFFRIRRPAPLYGRLATIHCAGTRAVDLLEVVAP